MSAIASCHADRQFDIAPKVNVANSISSNAPTKPAWVNEQFGKTIPRDFAIAAPSVWCGELGATLEGETIRLRVAGKQGAPSVLVLGGISGDRFVSDDAERKGWWSDIVRSGGDIDLDRYQVISIDLFPLAPQQVLDLTTADYAQLIHHALTTIGISHLHAFIGSSFGGMVGQAYARLFPTKCDKLITLCAAHQPSPMAQAWRSVQRKMVRFALDAGKPEEGVALARELAMTTYRTPEEFNARFSVEPGANRNVCSYLARRGTAYADIMSAQRFITLSATIDRHNEQPEAIINPTLLIATPSDRLVPIADVETFRTRLGGPSQLIKINSPYGHDAFLKETKTIGPIISKFLLET